MSWPARAQVVLACRNTEKGAAALREIDGRGARAPQVELAALDLASLDSVRAFAEELHAMRTTASTC